MYANAKQIICLQPVEDTSTECIHSAKLKIYLQYESKSQKSLSELLVYYLQPSISPD